MCKLFLVQISHFGSYPIMCECSLKLWMANNGWPLQKIAEITIEQAKCVQELVQHTYIVGCEAVKNQLKERTIPVGL